MMNKKKEGFHSLDIKIIIHKKLSLLVVVSLFLISSCAHKNDITIREKSIHEFQRKIDEQTPEIIKTNKEISLEECIQLALKNNIHVKTSEINKKIARLEKNMAFANFFPQINAEFQVVTYDRQPMVDIGPLSTAMQDKTIRIADIQLQMPIFAPATWFIYDLSKRGVDISNLVYNYTCQMISLQTTALYFQVLALENIKKSLEMQYEASKKLVEQMELFYEEGLITQSQKEQSILLKQLKERDLKQCEYEINKAKAQLNSVLGIHPLQEIKLSKNIEIPSTTDSLEDLILQALKNHPQIQIEDRKVEISEDEIKLAITQFLPLVGGFSKWEYTSNSYTMYSQSVLYGIHSVLTLFNGFANIQQYRIAREKREKAFLEREETALSLIVGVIRAKNDLEKAKEDSKLAHQAFIYQKEKFREENEKWNEGMITEVDLINLQAELGNAEINQIVAQIQEQIARAVLWNSIGKTYMGNSIYCFEAVNTSNEKEQKNNGKE